MPPRRAPRARVASWRWRWRACAWLTWPGVSWLCVREILPLALGERRALVLPSLGDLASLSLEMIGRGREGPPLVDWSGDECEECDECSELVGEMGLAMAMGVLACFWGDARAAMHAAWAVAGRSARGCLLGLELLETR